MGGAKFNRGENGTTEVAGMRGSFSSLEDANTKQGKEEKKSNNIVSKQRISSIPRRLRQQGIQQKKGVFRSYCINWP
jgi:hypothetical protein